jgi:rhamnogalacturonan endolyase
MRGLLSTLAAMLPAAVVAAASGPFLTDVGNQTWVIGNDVWNMTQGPKYGVKLYYKEHDCVGKAVGHYVSYSMSRCRPSQ